MYGASMGGMSALAQSGMGRGVIGSANQIGSCGTTGNVARPGGGVQTGGGLAFSNVSGNSSNRPIHNNPGYGFSQGSNTYKGMYPDQTSYNNSSCSQGGGGKKRKKRKRGKRGKKGKIMKGGNRTWSFIGKLDPSISNYAIGKGQGMAENQYSNCFKSYNHHTGVQN
jgi:hypothetical protein